MTVLSKLLDLDRDISDNIPYSHHADDHVIVTKNGDYVTTFKIKGRSHLAVTAADVERWITEVNTKFRGAASENLCIWTHLDRYSIDEYQDKVFDNVFCTELNEQYKKSFKNSKFLLNDYYLTIVYRPVVGSVGNVFSKWEKLKKEDKLYQQQAYLDETNKLADYFLATFKKYEPERLGAYKHQGRWFCSTLEFFRYLLTHKRSPVPITRERYCNYLCNIRPFFSAYGAYGELKDHGTSTFFGVYDIKEYDDITEAGHFNQLLESEFELVVSQSFSCISKNAAKGLLKRQRKLLEENNDIAISQTEALTEALDQLGGGKFVMGEHHMNIFVFGDTLRKTEKQMQVIADMMGDVGIVVTPCDLALEAAYFSQLPTNWAWRTRPSMISSANFWCFNSFHNFHSGRPTGNPWGDAVAQFKTTSGTPNFFNFHVVSQDAEDATGKLLLGNTLCVGQSRAGKTTLISFLAAMVQDRSPRMALFDKDLGMKVFVLAIGGYYSTIKLGEATGFNPLLQPRTFVKMFLRNLLEQDGLDVNHFDDLELEAALDILYNHEESNRYLTIFLQCLPNPILDGADRPTVAARLQKWCRGGEHGWAFDNPTDNLDMTRYRTYGFDITEFLDIPAIRSPMMMYLTHRTQSMIDGSYFIYLFDEYWKMMQDPAFQKLFKDKLKTISKEKGLCIFSSQEPADALASDIASTMVSQIGTMILLENPKADRKDYIDGLKLSEEEFQIVRTIPEGSRQFFIKQGDQTSIALFELKNMAKEILVLSGSPERAKEVETIITNTGNEDPASWLPIWWRQHGIPFEGFITPERTVTEDN